MKLSIHVSCALLVLVCATVLIGFPNEVLLTSNGTKFNNVNQIVNTVRNTSSASSGHSVDDNVDVDVHVQDGHKGEDEGSDSNYSATAKRINGKNGITLNIVLCMSGDGDGFLEETKVLLKSIVMNAPHPQHRRHRTDQFFAGLQIFIIADQQAYDSLPNLLANRTCLLDASTTWWIPISIHVINIQSQAKSWQDQIENILPPDEEVDLRHTWGTYFRLFAYRILPKDVDQFFYIDQDTIILANLAQLYWNTTATILDTNANNTNILFQWHSETAGFMWMRNTPTVWNLAVRAIAKQYRNYTKTIDNTTVNTTVNTTDNNKRRRYRKRKEDFNDQTILKLISYHYPNRVKQLSDPWGVLHWAVAWRNRTEIMKTTITKLGMGHFNGGSGNPGPFWNESVRRDFFEFHDQWGHMFLYYVYLPWSQVCFIGQSVGGGYDISVRYQEVK